MADRTVPARVSRWPSRPPRDPRRCLTCPRAPAATDRRPRRPHSCSPRPLCSPHVTLWRPRHVQNQVCLHADLPAACRAWARRGTSLPRGWPRPGARKTQEAASSPLPGGTRTLGTLELWRGGCVQETRVQPPTLCVCSEHVTFYGSLPASQVSGMAERSSPLCGSSLRIQ